MSSPSRRDEVLEEVRWLMSYRVVPERIAHQLGYANTENLVRVLRRYGEQELANELKRQELTYNECAA